METFIYAEADANLRREVIAELIRRFPGCSIFDCANGLSALALIEGQCPTLAIIDVAIASLDGLELFARLQREQFSQPIVLTSSNLFLLGQMERWAGRPDNLHLLAKPFTPEQLNQVLDKALPEQPSGILRGLEPLSVLQMFHQERKSCRVEARSRRERGQLVFSEGHIVRAHFNENSGEAAVEGLIRERELDFAVFALGRDEYVQPNVFVPLTELLLRCCQRLDEVAC